MSVVGRIRAKALLGAKALVKRSRFVRVTVTRVGGLLPPPRGRLSGPLAVHGGRPVRDTRFRPWASFPSATRGDWSRRLGPVMRRVFRHAREGQPAPLALEFARRWAEYCGAGHGLLLPHGTDALRVGLAAALDHDGLGYGGEVIVPNVTFVASATAALDRRLGVALVDVDPVTLNIDPRRVEEAIVPDRTKAIMAVHLFGQPADMAELRRIARQHSLVLIEDAAQAHGAIHELGRAGALGDVAGFSFQSSKNLPSGEGGALTTSDRQIFDRAYSLHDVGRTSGGQRWVPRRLGWNIRPSEYTAAVLLHRLSKLESQQERRWSAFLKVRERLGQLACLEPLGLGPGVLRHGVHQFVMRYRTELCGGLGIADFVEAIRAEGVYLSRSYETTLAEIPSLRQVAERHPDYVRVLDTPVADEAVTQIVYLPHPLFLGSERDLDEVAIAFEKVVAHYAPSASPSRRPSAPRATASAPARAASTATGPVLRVGQPKPLRVGVIGVGFMGTAHAAAIAADPRCRLVGVSDADLKRAQEVARERDCAWFATADELIESREADAIVIATPHWQHAELAIKCLRTGLHVVCEKPLTVTVRQGDDVLRAAAESPGHLAVVHQYRYLPAYAQAKSILNSGELGPLYRCSFEESAWRTEEYYRGSPWRGTWKGEGGGVLLNQAPHVLDRYAWFCGMPRSVSAHCDTVLHDIEVEDSVSAILHHDDGTHGFIHISTVECPSISRATLSCDRGRIVLDHDTLEVTRLHHSIHERTSTDTRPWGDIGRETRVFRHAGAEPLGGKLGAFLDDFLTGIAEGREPNCTGQDGLNVVELANAMVLSSAKRAAVRLPVDREEYEAFMARHLVPAS